MMGTLAPNQPVTGDSPLMLLPANDALSLALAMPAEGMAVLINNRLEHCVQELGADAACSLLIKLCAQCAPTKWGRLSPAVKSAVVKVFVLFLVYFFTCYPFTRDTCAVFHLGKDVSRLTFLLLTFAGGEAAGGSST